jgi:hypothetical protein
MYDEVPNTWMCELQTVDKAVWYNPAISLCLEH